MKYLPLALLVLTLAAAATFLTMDAFAQANELYCPTEDIIRGNVGTLIGFAIAFAGFITLIRGGVKFGFMLLLIGIMVTAFPGFYKSFLELLGTLDGTQNTNFSSTSYTCK